MFKSLLTIASLTTLLTATQAHAIMAESSCANLVSRKASFDRWAGETNGLSAFERAYDTLPAERRFKVMRAGLETAVTDLRWFSRVYNWSEYQSVIARADAIIAGYDLGRANEGSMLASLESLKASTRQALQRSKVSECSGAGPIEPACQPTRTSTGPTPTDWPPTVLHSNSGAAR